MSLDDKFDSNNGHILDNAHNIMLSIHKKIGEFYQDKTHKPVSDLIRGMHVLGGISSTAHSIQNNDPLMAAPAIINYASAITTKKKTNTLKEENFFENVTSKITGKYIDLGIYITGAAVMTINTFQIVVGAITGNYQLIKTGTDMLGIGLGVWSWKTAEYLKQIDFEPPKPKQKKKPMLEKIRETIEYILPKPAVHPIKITDQYTTTTVQNYLQQANSKTNIITTSK